MKRLTLAIAMALVGVVSHTHAQIAITPGSSYTQDFEGITASCGTFCGAACDLSSVGWINDPTDDMDWTEDEGGTGSGGTGPSVDHNPGTSSGKYLYTETSGCSNRTANLISPDFDFTGADVPIVSFWYHMQGATMGTMHFDVQVGVGPWDLNVIPSWTANVNEWQLQQVLLCAYAGMNPVRFRVRGETGTSFTSDMAVDDFTVYTNAGNDVSVSAVVTPVADACFDTLANITATITNPTCLAIANIPVVAQLGGTTLNFTYAGPLAAGGDATISLGTMNLSPGGTLKVYTNLAADPDKTNDTAYQTIAPRPVLTKVQGGRTFCGSGADTLEVSGVNTVHWYDAPVGGNKVFSGNPFITSPLTSTTSYYAEGKDSTGVRHHVGRVDNGSCCGGNFTSTGAGILFDVHSTITLDSVVVYPNGAGNITINLRSGATLQQTVTVAVPGNGRQRVPVGFTITPGSYELELGAQTTGGVYRSNSGSSYPYTDPSGSVTLTNGTLNNFYYFFYDWTVLVSNETCVTFREEFEVTITTSTVVASAGGDETICLLDSVQVGGAPTGSGGVGTLTYSWQPVGLFDDPNAANPKVSAGVGVHTLDVIVTDAIGCSDASSLDLTVHALPDVDMRLIGDDTICSGDEITLQTAFRESLTTTLAANNGQSGNMFDVVSTGKAIIIDSFDVHTTQIGNFEVWTKSGTHVGFEQNPGAWTLVGTVSGVPAGVGVRLPMAINVLIPAGQTQAFYVTLSNGTGMRYTNGGTLGSVFVSDANIQVLEGRGNAYPFGTFFTTRNWNGRIHYSVANPNDHLWSTGETTTSITVNPTTNTQYVVTVTDLNTCMNSDTQDIVANPLPVANAGLDQELCKGDTTSLGSVHTALAGTPPYTIDWTTGDFLDDSTVTNPRAWPFLDFDYELLVTDVNGCEARDTVYIDVLPLPVADAGFQHEICIGDSVVIGGAPSAQGGQPGYAYSWSPSTGLNDPTLENPTARPTADEIYNLLVTDAKGCQDTEFVYVYVRPLPNPTITPAGPFCANASAVMLTAATSGVWSGPGIVNPSTGAFSPAAATPGTWPIINDATSFFGCTASDTIMIQVLAPLVPVLPGTPPLCDGAPPVTLSATPTGGDWAGPGITNVSGTFDPSVIGIGAHQVTYTYTDGNGCVSTVSDVIQVMANPDATIIGSKDFCLFDPPRQFKSVTPGGVWSGTIGTNGVFDPQAAGVGTTQITYTAAIGNCVDVDSIIISVKSAPNPSISAAGPYCEDAGVQTLSAATAGGVWSGPGISNAAVGHFRPNVVKAGNHLVRYTVQGSNGCASTDTQTILVRPLPNASIVPAGPFCQSLASVQLTAQTPGGTWSGAGILDANLGTFGPSTVSPGLHTIQYEVVDAHGCSNMGVRVFEVTTGINVALIQNTPVLCFGDQTGALGIQANGGSPPYSYAWAHGPTTANITGQPAGTYDVTVTDVLGCEGSRSATIASPPEMTLTATATNATSPQHANGSIDLTVSGGTPPYRYIWSNNTHFEDASGLAPQFYEVTVFDQNDCQKSLLVEVKSDFTLSIDDRGLEVALQVYPNPTASYLTLGLELPTATTVNLEILDATGKMVWSDRFESAVYDQQLDASAWAAGVYTLRVRAEGEQLSRHILISR